MIRVLMDVCNQSKFHKGHFLKMILLKAGTTAGTVLMGHILSRGSLREPMRSTACLQNP